MSDEEIFAAAKQLGDANARSAYLQAACGDDFEQKKRIEALLAADEQVDSLLDAPFLGGSTERYVTSNVMAGDSIGTYKLLQRIGEGGFGVVFLAEQRKPISRRVALKVIKPGMDSRQVIARFEAERQALAMMDHPNIAKVYDAGVTDFAQPYFVMELVKGLPITRFCDEQKLPVSERLELLLPVCRAIQHAHQKGIIHRDIKPSNVLVSLYDGTPTPKVIDFGVAKAIERPLTEKTIFTQFGQILGTPEYMSPEQAELNQLDIDTRSDVYALGCLLYELLTGSTPLDRERLRSAAFDRMLRMLREEEPPRPSIRLSSTANAATVSDQRAIDPKRLSQLVRGDLDWVTMRALEKDRSRRYATANELAADLERYLNHEPVSAGPPTAAYRLRKFARKYRTVLATAAVFVGLLVLAAVVSTWQAVRATRAEGVAEVRRQAAEKAESQARVERDTADKERQRAQQSEADAQHNLYIANLHRIRLELESNNAGAARALLDLYRPGNGEKLRPGWEWYYWDRVCHAELHTLKGHSDRVMDVAYSPDGSLLATAGGDGDPLVKIWDSVTGEELRALHGHEYLVSQITFSPDGKLLATCSFPNGTVKLWDVSSWTEVSEWEPDPGDSYWSVAFSPNGTTLALCEAKGKRVRMWDLVSHSWAGHLPEGTDLFRMQYSPDGELIAGVTREGVEIWDVNQAKRLRTLTGHSFNDMEQGGIVSEAITGLAFSPDGLLLATCSMDGTVKIRKVHDGTEVRSITVVSATLQSTSGVNDLAFSPDGKNLVTAGVGFPLKLWEVTTGRELRSFFGQGGNLEAVAFSPDGTRLASAGAGGGEVKIWDAAGEPGQHMFLDEMAGTGNPTFSPDGKLLAIYFPYGMKTGQVRISDTDTGRVVLRLDHGLYAHVTAFAFSSDSTRVAVASYRHDPEAYKDTGIDVPGSEEVRVWDLANQQVVGTITGFDEKVRQLAFSPTDRLLATATQTYDPSTRNRLGDIKLWDTKTWKVIRSFSGISSAFHPPGSNLAIVGNDHALTLVDLETGQVQRTLPALSGRWIAHFSPDGNQLCDGTAVWNVSDGRQVCVLKGNSTPARFSPDGRRLFSLKPTSYASSGLLQVWDPATGDLLATIAVQAASGVSLHPDGWRCAVSGVPTGTWIVDARPLTDELRWKRDAQNLVAHLVRRPLLKTEILDHLKTTKTISEPLRREALTLAADLEPPCDVLASAAWDIVQYPNRSKEEYSRALRWLEEADQFPPKDAVVLSTLGLAHYRLGRYEDAVPILESAYKLNTSGYYALPAQDLVCLAMAQHQLGQFEEARKTLAKSRGDGGVSPHLVREAEALIESTLDTPME